MSANKSELEIKLDILRGLLDKHNADAILLRRVSSFAWATCGAASYVNTATTEGAASLIITRDEMLLLTNNIEAPRLEQEEALPAQGWKMIISPWETPLKGLQNLVAGKKLIGDTTFANGQDISAELSRLRSRLTTQEGQRFLTLGALCADAISAAAQAIHPGMSEFELAAILGRESQQRGIQPIVNLIATDERAYHYRHPLPTAKKLEKHALLVLSGRQQGLVCSVSRMVSFSKPSVELARRIRAAAYVNAVLIAHSRPGSALRDILALGKGAYEAMGFPDEWKHHHQGGVIGYEPREYLATSESEDILSDGQALAWNPTIAGAKMEDSILITQNSIKIMTPTPLWPIEEIRIPGQTDTVPCTLALEI